MFFTATTVIRRSMATTHSIQIGLKFFQCSGQPLGIRMHSNKNRYCSPEHETVSYDLNQRPYRFTSELRPARSCGTSLHEDDGRAIVDDSLFGLYTWDQRVTHGRMCLINSWEFSGWLLWAVIQTIPQIEVLFRRARHTERG